MNNPLLDTEFLKQLDLSRDREIYAKIISLSMDEQPIEEIEGKITGGSINIDGASAIRRTCSLTMVALDVNINDYYWGLKTKFKLYIGVKVPDSLRYTTTTVTNKIIVNNRPAWETVQEQPYLDYPDIIWFKEGIYVITGFSTSHGTNNYTINISGKDKGCLLNGDMGGNFPFQIDFGTETFYDLENNTYTKTKIPIKNIIRNMMHVYGHEAFNNIIINNLEDYGLELMEYRGDTPIYIFKNLLSNNYEQIAFDTTPQMYAEGISPDIKISIGDERVQYDKAIEDLVNPTEDGLKPTVFISDNGIKYTVTKLEYGDTAGYRLTDLTYAGELIANAGETISSILDKITKMLGNFEYYYDIDGRFIFLEKLTYINTSWNPIKNIDGETYVQNSAFISPTIYSFDGDILITSFNNNPSLNNIKNDYSVWGNRKGVTGTDIPIHMRIAIDTKPKMYKTLAINEDFINKCKQDFPDLFIKDNEHYIKPSIVYCTQAYYTDTYNTRVTRLINLKKEELSIERGIAVDKILDSDIDDNTRNTIQDIVVNGLQDWIVTDWREIIYQMAADYLLYNVTEDFYYLILETNIKEDGFSMYPTGRTNYEKYYEDINGFWRQLYNPEIEIYTGEPEINTQYYRWIPSTENSDGYFEAVEQKDLIELVPYDREVDYYVRDLTVEVDLYELGAYQLFREVRPDATKFDTNYTYFIKNAEDNSFEEFNIYRFTSDVGQLYTSNEFNVESYWATTLYENPEKINFWLDFLENNGELAQYSIPIIGDRPKVVNDNTVTAIYFKETPQFLYYTNEDENAQTAIKSGYTHIKIKNMDSLFTISSQGKSAKDAIDSLLYQFSYCTESVSINCIPIYYFEPNKLINIFDELTGINGEYLVTKMTIPLLPNGTMSITATKAVDRIY